MNLNSLEIMQMDILRDTLFRSKRRPIIMVSLLLCGFAAGCDREDDDLILQPSETSTVITGFIKSSDGSPLPDIPVAVDYTVNGGVFGTTVIHKAKGVTDKTGFFKIFFEADKIDAMDRGYDFSVDCSVLSSDQYIIAEELVYPFTSVEKWSGGTMKCDFAIPRKKLVNAVVGNSGSDVPYGKYSVVNTFRYLKVESNLTDPKGGLIRWWNELGVWRESEEVEMPQDGSVSVHIPCAVGIENAIRLVYKSEESREVSVSEVQTVEVTDDFNDDIVLDYHP